MGHSRRRHPVEAEAIGLMQNGNHKMYMFSVVWSDHNKVLIYRTFGEFKKLQTGLKKKFPLEAGSLNKSERTLPKLRAAPRTLVKKKNTRKSLETLRKLETYSQTLLKLDANISQCDLVVQFFTLQNHDLNPPIAEDSLFIVPSEKKEESRIAPAYLPDISLPMISHSYLCMADYETVDLRNRTFRVKRHELLDVLIKESTGWWLVENHEQQLAWFPAPYLQDHRSTEERGSDEECQDEGTLCVVIKSYESQNIDEISVTIGVVVEVLKKSDCGWWLISYNRTTGYIPSLYLKPYTNLCEKIQNILNRKQHVSTPSLHEGKCYRDAYSFLHHRQSLNDQRKKGNLSGNRERSQSLGAASLCSEARSDRYSDIDSTTGSSSGLNSTYSESSSLANSSPPLSAKTSLSDMPKVPPRPNPDEILRKCSTVTKKKVQRSLAGVGTLDPFSPL
ncbi:NADPH oxidase organizer 1-like [Pseudophryne corroboree]|uniref:NADPH oxidase organizer 1-like n=1 Tax=Pseudophryne corroboree TaxID=495146 RepID=UPI0030813C43